MAVYFVTERFLKLNGMITSNVDVTDFTPLVQYAAKAFVKKQIGSYFFEDLLTKYNNQTLSSDETTMVEKMQWAISWRATSEAVLSLSYQLKNKGIQKQSDDNSESVEMKEIAFVYDNYIEKAGYFEKEMKDYLIANKLLFPNYLSELNKDSIIKNDEYNARGNSFNEGVGLIII